MYEGPLKWAPARKQMHTRRASAYTETGWAGECVEHSAGTASREHWAMEAVKRRHAQAGTPSPPAAESTLRPSPARRALCRTTDRQRQAAMGGTMLRLDTCPHSGPSPQARLSSCSPRRSTKAQEVQQEAPPPDSPVRPPVIRRMGLFQF